MGLRGPAPKPTEIKRLEGNPGKRALNRREPRLEVRLPVCPGWLMEEAKREYRRVGKLLVRMRLLTEADRAALMGYAQAYARWKQAEEEIAKPEFEMVGTTDRGYQFVNPWLTVSANSVKQMRAFMSELGLTPSARSRIEAIPEDEREMSLADKLFAGVGAFDH